MFCVNCGNQLPEGVKFCPACGTPVAVEPVQEAPAQAATPVEVAAAPVEPMAAPVEPVVAATAAAPMAATAPVAAEPQPVYGGQPYLAPEQGYAPQQAYAPQQGGYAPEQGYVPQQAYMPQQGGYAPQQGYAPQPGYAPQSDYIPQGQPVPGNNVQQPPKKKKKTWLIILLAVLGTIGLVIVAVIAAVIIIGTIAAKKAKNAWQQLTSEYDINSLLDPTQYPGTEYPTLDPLGYQGGIMTESDLDHDVTIEEIAGKMYAGKVTATDVRGADELIAYLESVSGNTMTEEEKERYRTPNIWANPVFQLYIYNDEYSAGGWNLVLPWATGLEEAEPHEFSDWDLLGEDKIAAGTYFDTVAIKPVNNKFSVSGAVEDTPTVDYAGNLFGEYGFLIRDGQYEFTHEGVIRKGSLLPDSYGVDGKFTISIQYGDMTEPYVITYEYKVDEFGTGDYNEFFGQ